jgi:hypothetical protein
LAPGKGGPTRSNGAPKRVSVFYPVRAHAPELALVHRWLDSCAGIGLVVVGMARPGYHVRLGEQWHGPMSCVFLPRAGGHEPVVAEGMAQGRRHGGRCSGRRGRRCPSEALVAFLPPLELPRRIASEVKVVRLHPGVTLVGELDLNQVFDREGQIADRAFGAIRWSTRRAVGSSIGDLSGLKCRPNLLTERLATCSLIALGVTRRATALI